MSSHFHRHEEVKNYVSGVKPSTREQTRKELQLFSPNIPSSLIDIRHIVAAERRSQQALIAIAEP